MARALALAPFLLTAPLAAGEIPGAVIVLEVVVPATPGRVPAAAPPRFVLLESGQMFVGGTSGMAAGRLEKSDLKVLEKQVKQVRKLAGLGPKVALGEGPARYRLQLGRGRPLEILASGDPATAPPGLRPLASLLAELSEFTHASLRPWEPESYALGVKEGSLPGGCRAWGFPVPLADALSSSRGIPAGAASGWPTGAVASSVCSEGKSYVVTLRPLLPGERP